MIYYSYIFTLLPKENTHLEVNQRIFKEGRAYIAWKAESSIISIPIGTDSFEIKDGKIVWQSLAANIIQKNQNTKAPTYANGKICYIEIPAIDINISASFYNTVFGWNIRQQDNGGTSFDDTVGEVSGMWVTGRKLSTEPGLLISIMVDDIEASMKAVIANGGTIVQPVGIDAPEITARFSDPAGNVLSLYEERG